MAEAVAVSPSSGLLGASLSQGKERHSVAMSSGVKALFCVLCSVRSVGSVWAVAVCRCLNLLFDGM